MDKIYGSPGRQDGLYKIGRNKWELIYGFGKDSEDDETGWNYRQRFNYRPGLDEIKNIIFKVIEDDNAAKLRYGLVWNGLPVEYTEERKSDLTGLLVALQGNILQLPITLNLGSNTDGSPVFYEFTSEEDVSSVASALSAHKIAVCNEEWKEKYSVDWTVYDIVQ
jgi:hypothetical protein